MNFWPTAPLLAFAFPLVLGFFLARYARWLAALGVLAGIGWWSIETAIGGWEDLEGGAALGAILIGILVVAWLLGVAAGVFVRRMVDRRRVV
jgi:hypothetical protein